MVMACPDRNEPARTSGFHADIYRTGRKASGLLQWASLNLGPCSIGAVRSIPFTPVDSVSAFSAGFHPRHHPQPACSGVYNGLKIESLTVRPVEGEWSFFAPTTRTTGLPAPALTRPSRVTNESPAIHLVSAAAVRFSDRLRLRSVVCHFRRSWHVQTDLVRCLKNGQPRRARTGLTRR